MRSEFGLPLKDQINEIGDGLFYPLQYALDTWFDHKRFGIYPNGLPYDEQDPALLSDWYNITQRFNRIADRLSAADDEQEAPAEQEIVFEPHAPHWRDVMGKG